MTKIVLLRVTVSKIQTFLLTTTCLCIRVSVAVKGRWTCS